MRAENWCEGSRRRVRCWVWAPESRGGAPALLLRQQVDREGTDRPRHLEPNGTRMSGRHLITSRALRRCAAFAASAASLAVAAVAPTTAQAGTYEMHQCADPSGVHAPIVAEWSASKGDIDSNCPVGGPLHVRFTNTFSLRNGETGGLLLDVPASAPATRISGFRTA